MANYNQNWDELGRSIQNAVDRAVNSKDYQKLNQSIHQVVDRTVGAVNTAVNGIQNANRGSYPVKKNLYGNTIGKIVAGILKIVGGFPIAFLGFIFTIGGTLDGRPFLQIPVALILSLMVLGGGAWLMASGINTLRMVARYYNYRRTLGKQTYCPVEKLARRAGKSVKFVRKDLHKMIGKGLFLEGNLDREERNLITSHETYQYYEQSRLALEERQRQEAAAKLEEKAAPVGDPQVRKVLEQGNAFIVQIRKCNDDIPGEAISEKISRIELIVQRIFERAKAHPEIVPDLKKLMDYYLPMTVKLLNAYAEMDAQPVQGENIQASKREIEQALDTLNLAFEKLLDSVFADTALDVSSDISVLNTLLAQEGLTGEDFKKNNRT